MTRTNAHNMPLKPAPLPEGEVIDVPALLRKWQDGIIDLICVMGPTASGKTRYAVGLARQLAALSGLGVEIISADSRQVYRGMDIGTGKDLCEYGDVPVHLIDIVDAGTKYDIYQYQRDFEHVFRDITERGCLPILCGGSGLYVEAVTKAYNLPDVPANETLRAEWENCSDEELIARLAALKPLHNSTDYDTRKRLIRALEIAVYESEHPVERTHFLPKSTYFIGTLVSRETRNARIDRRLDQRLQEGMIEEIKGLLDRGIASEDLIYYGLEYKFVTLYLTGQLSFDQMREQLATAIHQFAKRQMTWLRGMERRGTVIHWTEV